MRLSGRPCHTHKVDHFQLKTVTVAFFTAGTVPSDYRPRKIGPPLYSSKQQTSNRLEEELLEWRRKLGNRNLEPEEFNEENIRLKAENEFKEKMIEQLMSKLSTPSGFFPPPNQYDPRLQYQYSNSMMTSEIRVPEAQSSSNQVPQKSMNSEYPDSECQICLVEMKPEQKTINCNQCKKQFHSHVSALYRQFFLSNFTKFSVCIGVAESEERVPGMS